MHSHVHSASQKHNTSVCQAAFPLFPYHKNKLENITVTSNIPKRRNHPQNQVRSLKRRSPLQPKKETLVIGATPCSISLHSANLNLEQTQTSSPDRGTRSHTSDVYSHILDPCFLLLAF